MRAYRNIRNLKVTGHDNKRNVKNWVKKFIALLLSMLQNYAEIYELSICRT